MVVSRGIAAAGGDSDPLARVASVLHQPTLDRLSQPAHRHSKLVILGRSRQPWGRVGNAAAADPFLDKVQYVLLDRGLPDAEAVGWLRKLLSAPGSAAICVLTGRFDEHLGVAAVAEGAQDSLVSGQVDSVLLARVLRYAAERERADENARRLREVELRQAESARLERGLLPHPLMQTTEVAVHTFYRAGRAMGLLGGDFFDVVQVGDDRLHVIVGDVCGHGVDEAALGVELRVAWRALVLAGVPDGQILSSLEQVLMSERRAREIYATVASVVIDLTGNRATVQLAGHPPPVLLADGRAVGVAARAGIVLGVRPSPAPATEVEFTGTDWTLLMYTDGLIEGHTGAGNERLDVDGLCELLGEPAASQMPLTALPAWLVGRAEQANRGPLPDDVTMLLISRGGRRCLSPKIREQPAEGAGGLRPGVEAVEQLCQDENGEPAGTDVVEAAVPADESAGQVQVDEQGDRGHHQADEQQHASVRQAVLDGLVGLRRAVRVQLR